MTENINKHFYNIDFFRVFLILAIVLFHNRIHLSYLNSDLYSFLYNAFGNGRNAVDAFFVISGFFLILTFKPALSIINFIKKKYIRLSPVIAFSVLLCTLSWAMGATDFKLIPNITTIFLLNSFGRFWCIGSNVVLWYTSALFFGLFVFYCINKFVAKKYIFSVIFSITFLSILLLQILRHGDYDGYDIVFYHIISVSTLRAFAGIGTGSLIALSYNNILKISDTFGEKIFSILEILCFGFIFWWMFCVHNFVNHFYFLLIFSILFICFLIKKGILSTYTDKPIWAKLGKYTYSIFVTHYIIIRILYMKLWKNNTEFVQAYPYIPIFINLFAVLLLGIVTYHCIEKPCTNMLSKIKKENS